MSRNFIEVIAEQRSPVWFSARLGRLTGSRAKDMLATIKSGEAAARRDLRTQLVVERLTGRVDEDGYQSPDMLRGIEMEPAALRAYEAATGHLVARTGFLRHTEHMAGCSLDGHVGDYEGILEIKCPRSANHLKYLRAGALPSEHAAQVAHNLWVTGAKWCDFVSFDDRFPAHLQLAIIRVEHAAVSDFVSDYHSKALAFLAEVEREYRSLLPLSEQVQ